MPYFRMTGEFKKQQLEAELDDVLAAYKVWRFYIKLHMLIAMPMFLINVFMLGIIKSILCLLISLCLVTIQKAFMKRCKDKICKLFTDINIIAYEIDKTYQYSDGLEKLSNKIKNIVK
jgi:hypothetical protein